MRIKTEPETRSTIVDQVREHLAQDPSMRDVLHRDLLSIRRSARWLIENEYIDPRATEEATVSAIRRWREPDKNLSKEWRALLAARIDVRTGDDTTTLIVYNATAPLATVVSILCRALTIEGIEVLSLTTEPEEAPHRNDPVAVRIPRPDASEAYNVVYALTDPAYGEDDHADA